MTKLDELEALEAKATPGPWEVPDAAGRFPDAALMAAARNALPELIAACRAADDLTRRSRCMGNASGCECRLCMAHAVAEAELVDALAALR